MVYALSVQGRVVKEGKTVAIVHAAWLGQAATKVDAKEDVRILAMKIARGWEHMYDCQVLDVTVNAHYQDGTHDGSDFVSHRLTDTWPDEGDSIL